MQNIQSWEYLDQGDDLQLSEFVQKTLDEFNQGRWLEKIIPDQVSKAFIGLYDGDLGVAEIMKVGESDQGVKEPLDYMFAMKSKRMRVILSVLTAKQFECSPVTGRY